MQRFWRRDRLKPRKRFQHRKLNHYSINTVVAIAYRVNNEKCRQFLELYHRAIVGLQLRLSGSNYYIPSIMEGGEYLSLARVYSPPLELDFEDG